MLTPARIAIFNPSADGWTEISGAELGSSRPATRDPRGIVLTTPTGFDAWAPGLACTGVAPHPPPLSADWSIQCHPSDDPWPIAQPAPGATLKAFYNAARDYFTGVITPASPADLPPFYTAAMLPERSTGHALLIGGIDGKVSLAEGGELKPVSGTRNWGSDFAIITPACRGASEVIVSSSGESLADSLRSFEIAGQNASPESEPLDLGGTATALSPTSDGTSTIAIIRLPLAGGRELEYEVDRVSATCD